MWELCCRLVQKLHLFIRRALVNHDTTHVLGRTTDGTLELKIDDIGVCGRVTINQSDPGALALYERVKRMDLDQCSFGFNVLEEKTETQASFNWRYKK